MTVEYVFAESAAASDSFNRRTASADASHLVPHLRPGMEVVDFGCGTGSLTVGLAAIVAPGEVVGFDRSESAITQARVQAEPLGLSNLRFDVADIRDLELPEHSFDVAHFSGVLSHLADPRRALSLAHRTLRPGGLIAAREPQKEGDWYGGPYREAVGTLNRLTIEDWKSRGGDPFLGRRLGELLREAGFERVELLAGCAPALSNRQAVGAFARRRLAEPDFIQRVVERRWITLEQLREIEEAIRIWAASDDSVVALAECAAIARKPW